MSKKDTKKDSEKKQQIDFKRPPADQLLREFLNENGLKLSPDFKVRRVDDGSIIITPDSVKVSYADTAN